MSSGSVVVLGSGQRAAEWATRLLASGFDVTVDDPTVVDLVAHCWPSAERLGLFPGAALERLRVGVDDDSLRSATLVHVVGPSSVEAPAGVLVATEATARAMSPIHLVPLVELADGPLAAPLAELYRSIGMAPCLPDVPADERHRLGAALVEVTGGDPDSIIAVLRALRATGVGAGPSLAEHEARRYAQAVTAPWQEGDAPGAPLDLYRARVEPDWVDYNGHMTEAAYLTAAGWASDALFRYIGDDEAYRAAGHSFYTVETHITYLLEVDVHEPLRITTQILGVDAKRVHLVHDMRHGDTDAQLCVVEQMLVHVDMHAGRSAPILPHVFAALTAIRDAHTDLPVPPQIGRVMQLPPPRP
jgi:acyl-CoA thioesterase FadM